MLETCQATDRVYPHYVDFKCFLKEFNANMSYGVGFIDRGDPGVEGQCMSSSWFTTKRTF